MKTTKAAELQTTKIATRSKGSAANKAQIFMAAEMTGESRCHPE
jgi:hypothetical protein